MGQDRTGWGAQDGMGERRGRDERAPRFLHELRSRRGKSFAGEQGQGWDRREGKAWDGGERMRTGMGRQRRDGTERTGHTGGQCSHPQPVVPGHPQHTPDPEPPRRGWAGVGDVAGLGGTGDVVGTLGGGCGPSVGLCAFHSGGSVGTPNPGTPALATAGCPCPLLPAGGPGLGAPPLCRVGARPRTLPARTHAHTHTHAYTRAGTCMGPRPWGAGQGTGDPRCPRPVTPRCAPDPPAEAHAGHALPALRTLFPR